MAMSDERTKRDLILPPGTYAYMRDTASGAIKTATGPTVINPTAQEEPIIYDPDTASFKRVGLEEVSRKSVIAPEGYYVILRNPSTLETSFHPSSGKTQMSAELDVGRKIIIPGPAMFPLWPGQAAAVVRGHQIKFNEYLVARVYNEEQALKNWQSAVMKPAKLPGVTPDDPTSEPPTAQEVAPPDLTVGTLLIIRGDQVSFYIPPTGITVQKGENGEYVQDALTLERLEYAILVGQDGNKRYEIGPQVVFPLPSERFVEARDDNGSTTKKFRAVELNNIQGLHIKVIADYVDNKSVKHNAGDELFITGKDTAIYYPREEHSAIKYDGQSKHFAVAVPAGEARYVMNRETGEIDTFKGPGMLLPDPRTKVIVRRTLTENQASLWYPGNQEVAEYNRHLRSILSLVPTTRQGAISEGDFVRNSRGGGGQPVRATTKGVAAVEKTSGTSLVMGAASVGAAAAHMDSSRVSGDQNLVGEEFSRRSTYNQPRTIDLNTKFQGAPKIKVFTGYAVQVIATNGHRKVVKGPQTLLLDYDQELDILALSQGKPKTTDKILHTAYLRVENNKVSDIIEVETADHVKINLYLSYNINFEGDDKLWFSVENYVQFACHHVRSVLQGAILKVSFDNFYTNSRDTIRDIVLGKPAAEVKQRPGMVFKENGMRIGDVDITKVDILDQRIKDFINTAQFDAVKSNLDLAAKTRELSVLRQSESIAQQMSAVKADTKKLEDVLSTELINSRLRVILAEANGRISKLEQDKLASQASEDIANFQHESKLERDRLSAELQLSSETSSQKLRLEELTAETVALVDQFKAITPGFAEALTALGNKDTMVKVAQAWSIQRALGGENVSDALRRIFTGTPVQAVMEKIAGMAVNGSSKLPTAIDSPIQE